MFIRALAMGFVVGNSGEGFGEGRMLQTSRELCLPVLRRSAFNTIKERKKQVGWSLLPWIPIVKSLLLLALLGAVIAAWHKAIKEASYPILQMGRLTQTQAMYKHPIILYMTILSFHVSVCLFTFSGDAWPMITYWKSTQLDVQDLSSRLGFMICICQVQRWARVEWYTGPPLWEVKGHCLWHARIGSNQKILRAE